VEGSDRTGRLYDTTFYDTCQVWRRLTQR